MYNLEYWKSQGANKTFTHPLSLNWISDLSKNSSILDLGCGYGRVAKLLIDAGYNNILGYDPSQPLIERAVMESPGGQYTSNVDDLEGKYFDLICCIALFTSCPEPHEHGKLKTLIEEGARSGAYLYISDYETADNPHYKDRYEQCIMGIYGCFGSANVVFRHHEPGYFDSLFSDWKKINEQAHESRTLNGNEITIRQHLYKRG